MGQTMQNATLFSMQQTGEIADLVKSMTAQSQTEKKQNLALAALAALPRAVPCLRKGHENPGTHRHGGVKLEDAQHVQEAR